MRPWIVVWMVATGCAGSDGGGNGKGGRDGDEPLDCGFNAYDDGGSQCECAAHYSPCRDDAKSCCAYDASSFTLTVVGADVMPFNADGAGWDWDGDVPDWMIDVANLVGLFSVEAATIAEVLEYTDELAPEVLEGTVPPDPFFEVWEGEDDQVDVSWTVDNDFSARWEMQSWVAPTNQKDIYLWFRDEDLLLHDDIALGIMPRDTFETVAGWGPVEFRDIGMLFSLTVEIEPNF
jgi:hypothetical protein